jgi:hypothetical protein
MSDQVLDVYWQIPPITRLVLIPLFHLLIVVALVLTLFSIRTFVTAIVITSIGCHFGLLPYAWFYYDTSLLLKFPPEIWRPFTSFFLSSPKLGIILDPYWVYQYMTQLELANTRLPRKEDVLWYLLTVGATIIVSFHSPLLTLYLLLFLSFPFHHNISARLRISY